MARKVVFECDVCGIQPKDDDLSTWRTVNIGPLEPPSVDPNPVAPPVGMPAVPGAMSPFISSMVCHKPSCLTKLAKDWNEAK